MRQKTCRIAFGTVCRGFADSPAVMPTLSIVSMISGCDAVNRKGKRKKKNRHFCTNVQRAGNDKRLRNAVNRIGKRTPVVPALETDRRRSDAAGADANGEDEEDRDRQYLDPVDQGRSSARDNNSI
jgi:hypothetical protein